MGKSYCSNCGAKLDDDSQFCSECGKHAEVRANNSTNNSNIQNVVNSILNRPKLIILILGVVIVILGMGLLFNSNNTHDLDMPNGEVYDTVVYGMAFHIPNGYEETNRADFTNGEYVDFSKDGWTIEISVSKNSYFKKSQYVQSSYHKTVNGKQGTVYNYKFGHSCFVYFENGYRVVIRDANNKELEEIIT